MSNSVPYVLLHTHIKSLVDYLNRCVIKPELLLSRKEHWDNSDRVSDLPGRRRFEKKLFDISENKDLLKTLISVVCSAMLRCIEKQLLDLLPGGQFINSPSEEDVERTGYAHLTNLG